MISYKRKLKPFIVICLVSLLLSELIILNAKNWIPEDLIRYLSPNAVIKIYQERSQIQDADLPIIHYRPFQKLNLYPYLKIDENGFRNSIYNQTEVDTVLLGDSLLFARRSKIDLGDLFRRDGKSALNFGMGGNAPQDYRDTYKKYVIGNNVQHKNVIVIFFPGNDFRDSRHYPRELSPPIAKGKWYFPWTINLIIGAIDISKGLVLENNLIKNHRISLPYKTIGANYLWWTPEPSDEQWDLTEKALDEIINMAKTANANVSFVIVPSPASVYGARLHPDFISDLNSHNDIVDDFKRKFKDINIIDPTSKLATEIEKQFLYVADRDAHFNTFGTKVLYQIIKN